MFELNEISEMIEERKQVLNWVISGLGVHGFKIKDSSKLSWEFIVRNYNIEEYKCKHLDVCEIGYVYTLDGREYDGYCNSCNSTVHGIFYYGNKKYKRWF